MKVEIRDREALSSLSLLSLRTYLKSRGWVDEGEWGKRATIYSTEHEGKRWEYLCPLRDTVVDYAECMAEAVEILAKVEERSELDVFHDLAGAGADVIRLRSLNGVVSEALSLGQSAEMLSDAYDMLASAARAVEKPKATYRGRVSANVSEYLDEVQPLPGYHEGYSLTLHSPVPAGIGQQIDFGDTFTAPFPRRATSQLARALGQAMTAVEKAVVEDSLEPFGQGVQDGVSANLCDAVAELTSNGRGIEIGLSWADVRPAGIPDCHFRFTENSAGVLTEAAMFLRHREPSMDELVMAQVVRLERQPDEFDGNAVILTSLDGRFVHLKVTFEQSVYDMVIQAFQERSLISMTGDIYPEGNGYTLQRPHNLTFVEDIA